MGLITYDDDYKPEKEFKQMQLTPAVMDPIQNPQPSFLDTSNPNVSGAMPNLATPPQLDPGVQYLYQGKYQSPNFAHNYAGWNIDSEGNAEFNNGTFRGTFNIGGTVITIDNTQSIQTYLDLISVSGGGTLYLQPGTYTLTADISVPSRVTLAGVTRDGVLIDCNSAYKLKITGSNPYTTGTVTVSAGSTSVLGIGTTFTSAMVGQYILLSDKWYLITAFTDTTHITIANVISIPAKGSPITGGGTFIPAGGGGAGGSGGAITGASFCVATINVDATIRTLTVTNATASGVAVSYAKEPKLDDLVVYSCGTGIDFDYVSAHQVNVSAVKNGVNADFNFAFDFQNDFCEFSESTTGAGCIMTNCGYATFLNSAVAYNTGNGLSLTSCNGITFFSMDVSTNGAKGIELVSNSNDNQFIAVGTANNVSDNIKLTATSSRNIITTGTVSGAGGYGINIAASSCTGTAISGNGYSANISGDISDSGTSTFVADLKTAIDVYQSAVSQVIPASTFVTVMFDVKTKDAQSEFNSATRTGTATATTANKLVNSSGAFTSADLGANVWNTTSNTYATITNIDSSTQVTISANIMTSGNTYRLYQSIFTCKITGTYLLSGVVAPLSMASGKRIIAQVRVNGGNVSQFDFATVAGSTSPIFGAPSINKYLVKGDTVTVVFYHEDTVARSLNNSAGYTNLYISKIA